MVCLSTVRTMTVTVTATYQDYVCPSSLSFSHSLSLALCIHVYLIGLLLLYGVSPLKKDKRRKFLSYLPITPTPSRETSF